MPSPGDVLNERYQLQALLGRSSSRQTWLAQDLAIVPPEFVVIKLLAFNPQIQWEELKLFKREANLLKRLRHPRIPQYRDYFSLESLPGSRFSWFALVQTCIPGLSLQQFLDQGKHFTTAKIEKIAMETLHILVYLHGHRPPILHRDIKPSNLIWGEDNWIYLVDFGSVQDEAAREGATFTVVGTYGYVPMEQFAGRAVPASDLYALGTTLIHLLTGRSPADLPHENARVQFSHLISADPSLINWLSKLTAPHLSERVCSAQYALAAWKERYTLSAPILRPRPTGSQIRIEKSAQQLDIYIPARKNNTGRNFSLDILLAKLGHSQGFEGFILWTMGILAFPLLLSYANCAAMWFAYIKTELHCDRYYITILRKIPGLGYCSYQRLKTSDIRAVYEDTLLEGSNIQGVVLETHLGQTATTNPLAAVERAWLIQEIAEWLNKLIF